MAARCREASWRVVWIREVVHPVARIVVKGMKADKIITMTGRSIMCSKTTLGRAHTPLCSELGHSYRGCHCAGIEFKHYVSVSARRSNDLVEAWEVEE